MLSIDLPITTIGYPNSLKNSLFIMFKFGSKEPTGGKLAGPGFITLNVLRVINVIVLLTVAVASWIMLVKTVMTSNVSKYP